MCGIIGVLRFGEPTTPSYNASALYLATSLLEASEARGKDATGITALFDDGNFFVQKMAISATEFCARAGGKPDDYEGLLAVLRGYSKAQLRCILGHCRKKSVGALDNTDNHPIKAGNILGVHNGTLKNDAEIFKNLDCQRDGEVDSEAIFRLLQFFTNDCADAFTIDAVKETCKRLEGTFSFLAFNANNPYQVVSARDGRPAEYCLIKPLGMVLIASEKKFIERALYSYSKLARLFPTGNEQTALVSLKQSDVEHETLVTDTIAIFDLTRTVTAETKLSDLYDTCKIPFLIDRLWKSSTTSVYTGNNSYGTGNHSNNAVTTNNYEGKKNTTQEYTTLTTGKTTTEVTACKETTGRVWNNTLNKFVVSFGKREVVQSGVVINTETKKVTSLIESHIEIIKDAKDLNAVRTGITDSEVKKTTGTVGKCLLDFSSSYPVEDFSNGEAVEIIDASPDIPIQQITMLEKIDKSDTEKAIVEMKRGIKKGKQSVAGELGATEAATIAAKAIEKFESDLAVADFMSIDESSLFELSPKAIANRLIRRLFAKFFVQGWLDCYKSINTTPINDDIPEKLERAEKHVRILKVLQTSLIQELTTDDPQTLRIITETAKTLAETSELSREAMQAIFSTGDIRKSSILRYIVASL